MENRFVATKNDYSLEWIELQYPAMSLEYLKEIIQ